MNFLITGQFTTTVNSITELSNHGAGNLNAVRPSQLIGQNHYLEIHGGNRGNFFERSIFGVLVDPTDQTVNSLVFKVLI